MAKTGVAKHARFHLRESIMNMIVCVRGTTPLKVLNSHTLIVYIHLHIQLDILGI